MTFFWQTDEEGDWDEIPDLDSTPPRRSTWLIWCLSLGILLAGGYTIYQAFTKRVETVSADLSADVLGSHRLLEQAAADRDDELFRALLSARIPGWSDGQRQLFLQGGLADRAALGLRALPGPSTAQAVNLSADLEEAEVIVTRDFALVSPAGVTETISLDQVEVFRRGEARWLLAPSTADAWTSWASLSGRYLELMTIERDREIAGRLLQDLESDLDRLCGSGFTCPAALSVGLRLDPDPATLLGSGDLRRWLSPRVRLVLPAPSLVGLPRDEVGYEALRRAYSARLIASVVAQSMNYACCERALFIEALLTAHLHTLGLGPPLADDADYQVALRESLTLGDLYNTVAPYWFRPLSAIQPKGASWRARLLIDFLLAQRPEMAPGSLYQSMMTTRRLGDWSTAFVTGFAFLETDPALERLWIAALARRANASSSLPPELTGAELLALCTPDEALTGPNDALMDFPHVLYRYDDHLNGLAPASAEAYTSLVALPAGGGAILQRVDLAGSRGISGPAQSLVLWRQGESQSLYSLPPQTATTVQSVSPDGSAATLLSYPLFGGRPPQTLLLELDGCAEAGCSSIPLPPSRMVRWSPDGKQFLLLGNDRLLRLVDRDGRIEHLSGPRESVFAAAWQDKEHVLLYDQPVNGGRPGSLQRLRLASKERQVLVDKTLLIEASSGALTMDVEILSLSPLARDPNRVLVTARTLSANRPGVDLLWLDLDSDTADPWLTVERSVIDQGVAPAFSQTEDAVAFMMLRFDSPYGELFWRDLDGDSTLRVVIKNWFSPGAYAWSPDGEWLAIARDQYIYVIAPRTGEERVLVHGLARCNRVAWDSR